MQQGNIDSSIGYLTDLKVLDISDNDLTQDFSHPIWVNVFNSMAALEQLNFDNNNFGGTIIDALCADDGIEFTYEGTSIAHSCD